MSLFKRIFGKGDTETDKRVEKELEQIKSGEIDKIYPILKPGDWPGITYGAIRQTLIGTPEAPYLVVGFGYDAPSNFVFLMPKDIEGKDSSAIIQQAYANLEAIPSPFEISDVFDGRVLTASGNDFSSEKILCESHMQRAHDLLNADRLLVSIPRRRCMMIIAENEEQEMMSKFLYLHQHAWEDDSFGNAPITHDLFLVENAQIIGVISPAG